MKNQDIMAQKQAAVDAGNLILDGYLQFREVRPGSSFRIGPVTISRQWGPALQCKVTKDAVRTDNGPAVSHGGITFTLPDDSQKKYYWMSGGPSPYKWGYEIQAGQAPESPNPELPFRNVSVHNAPQPGSGYSAAKSAEETVTVRFAGEETTALDEWVRLFIEEAFRSGVNPLPSLRKIYPGQWSFARYQDGRGMIHYCQASPMPVWSGNCTAEIPCD